MVKKPVMINISAGTENRPIAHLVQAASQYESRIYLETENKKINAKSIMGMMTLNLTKGEELVVSADGEDEVIALECMEEYLTGKRAG